MGTVASFSVAPGELSEAAVRVAIEESVALLREADALFSTYIASSPMSRLRRGELGLAQAPGALHEVLEACRRARALSGGWFDPWAMPGGVDPTGLVKGWAAEQALAHLAGRDVAGAMLNVGGDIMVCGEPSPKARWRVGIRHPWRHDALACVVEADGAVATSGLYERGPHLINPFTKAPSAAAASATVTGPSLALADALATALAVGGGPVLEQVATLAGYAAYLITSEGDELVTNGFHRVVP